MPRKKKDKPEVEKASVDEDEIEVTDDDASDDETDDERASSSPSSDDDDLDDDDSTSEINVEELIAKVDAVQGNEAKHAREIHRRLEELKERREAAKSLADSYDFDFD